MITDLNLELKRLQKDLIYIKNSFNIKDLKIIVRLIDSKEFFILNKKATEFYQIKLTVDDLKKWNDGSLTYDDLSFSRKLLIKQSEKGFSILLVRLLRARGRQKIYDSIYKDFYIDGEYTLKANHWICPHQNYLISRDCINNEKEYISCPAHGWRFNLKDGKCILGDTKMKLRDSE